MSISLLSWLGLQKEDGQDTDPKEPSPELLDTIRLGVMSAKVGNSKKSNLCTKA